MSYYDLIDFIKDEMARQGITKTKLCELTGTNMRNMNAYLYKEHCMPLEKLMCILEILGKRFEIVDASKERAREV